MLQPTMLLGAAALTFLALVVYNQVTVYLSRQRFQKQHGCKPPQARYPQKHSILGLDLMRENFRLAKNKELLAGGTRRFERLGTTFATSLLHMPIIATIEPQNVKTILSLRFNDFSLGNRERPLGPLLGKGIFTTDGQRWAQSRHMIRPNFSRDQVADLDAFERHVQSLLSLIPRDGSTVDLQDLFFRLTIDSATEFLFGHSVDTLKSAGAQAGKSDDADFAQAFNYAQQDSLVKLRLGPLAVFRYNPKGNEAVRICHRYVDRFVEDAVRYRESHDLEKHAPKDKYLFLHELAKSTMDKRRLRDELMNVLLAGRDTTASLLSNLFFEIAKRPHVWNKLKAEVGQLNGRVPTYEQLRNLKYLKWCINESLRVHPAVPGNSRLAIRDTVLPLGGGPDGKSPLFVKKGTIVMYSVFAMHRRKDYYGEDADDFRPERWESLRPGWEYLPFNGGPRICLGQQYALTEASYVMTRILQEFSGLESRDPNPWVESVTLTVCSDNGTKVALTPASA